MYIAILYMGGFTRVDLYLRSSQGCAYCVSVHYQQYEIIIMTACALAKLKML